MKESEQSVKQTTHVINNLTVVRFIIQRAIYRSKGMQSSSFYLFRK